MAYYVKIEKPREFRRDVLESSKQVIGCLQEYRNISYVRDRKRQLMKQLQDEVKEIVLLFARLDKVLPEKHLREEAMRKAKEEERKVKAAAKKAAADALRAEEERKAKASKKPAAKKNAANAKKKSSLKKKEAKPVEPSPEPKKVPTEMDKLNDALSSIESKLSKL